MAEINIIGKNVGRPGNSDEIKIQFRLTHNHKRRIIDSGYKVSKTQFSPTKLVIYRNDSTKINNQLKEKLGEYRDAISDIAATLKDLTIDEVRDYISAPERGKVQREAVNIFAEAQDYMKVLESEGRARYAKTFRDSAKHWRDWWGSDFLTFETLVYSKLLEFEDWMKVRDFEMKRKVKGKTVTVAKHGYSKNTISTSFRCLRALFNRAIDYDKIPESLYPFRKFNKRKRGESVMAAYPSQEPRDITIEQLRAVRDLDLSSDYHRTKQARDIFMLSFYLVGMNLTDIWGFDFSSLIDNKVSYARGKTSKKLQFSFPEEALSYVNTYVGKNGKLELGKKGIKTEGGLTAEINKGLKRIGEKTKIKNLTFYCARHTWATIANTKAGMSLDEVDLALSHGAKTVTGGYINLDRSMIERIDNGHRKVLEIVARA